jgi:hypothetical protein
MAHTLRQLVLSLAVLACGLALRPCPAAEAPRADAVVYLREGASSTEVVWQRLGADHASVLYSSTVGSPGFPGPLMMLPSPDGRWVLVWYQQRAGGRAETRWIIVRTSDASVWELGVTPQRPGADRCDVLPAWIEEGRLALARGGRTLTANPRTRRLSTPWEQWAALPEGTKSAEEDQRALMQFVGRRFPGALRALEASLKGLGDRVAAEARTPPLAYLVLRAKGLPCPPPMGLEGGQAWPLEVSVSPDGSLVARADIWKEGRAVAASGVEAEGAGVGAQLDVFSVSTGERLWYARIASVPRWTQPGVTTIPHERPWTSPRFADVRWSGDGHCLSFSFADDNPACGADLASGIVVLDATTWQPALNVAGARDAFVVPAVGRPESP